MLRFYAALCGGREVQLTTVHSAVIDCAVDIPAASARLFLPYDAQLRRDACGLLAKDGDRTVFWGDIDSIISETDSGGASMKLYARSVAARLLDNEAEPLDYRNPSAALIYRRHAQPFGLRCADPDRSYLPERMQIQKGMSHWQVLDCFCRAKYRCAPHVSADGTLYLKGLPRVGTAVFDNSGSGIPYHSLSESLNRYRLLSDVRVKTGATGGYGSAVVNPNPACRRLTRRRYVDVSSGSRSMDTVQQMLDSGNHAGYVLSLTCGGCQLHLTGSSAVVRDNLLGETNGLIVSGVKYKADSSGAFSEITFEKEKF